MTSTSSNRRARTIASASLTAAAVVAVLASCVPPAVEARTLAIPDSVVSAIVRVAAAAPACDASLFGTGLIVAPERVLTNAHVVAGSSRVVVAGANSDATPGAIVYFDPHHDLAVIAVPGLSAAPLRFTDSIAIGGQAIVADYQTGSDPSAISVTIRSRDSTPSTDIYGETRVTLDYWTIRGTIEPGASGAPLLTSEGRVFGLVFAKGEGLEPEGYALSLTHVAPVVERAAGYTIRVDTGRCVGR